MATIAIYPGTFDPITNGHIDIIERASTMFDKVIVLIGVNSKKKCMFTEAERKEMAEESLSHLNNVSVDLNHRLTVEYGREIGARTIIRGIRQVTDFEYEFQIALMNRKMEPDIHTLFMMPHEKYTYLNSSIIRELAIYGKDVSEFVSESVQKKLIENYKKSNREND